MPQLKKRNEVLCWYFIFLQITDQKSRGVSYQKREKNDKWHQSDRWFHYFLKPSNFAWITARNFNSLLKITTKQFSNGQILPLKFQVTNSLILFLRKKKRIRFWKDDYKAQFESFVFGCETKLLLWNNFTFFMKPRGL